MKKILSTIILVAIVVSSYSQGINFQGVARSANGTIIAGSNVSLRLSIISKNADALPEYVETKTVLTNAQGIFSIVVGDASNTAVVGSFKNIVWSEGPKFLKVEMDPAGGTNYLNMGSTQLQNVPFAYYSYGVNAANVNGILPIASGGTGVSSLNTFKSNLGIDLINNTSDLDKPISNSTKKALDLKFNIADTINFTKQKFADSVMLTKVKYSDTALMLNNRIGRDTLNLSARIDTRAPLDSPTFRGIVRGITKSMVGLDSVNNTADIDKPISTLTQAALNTKISSETFSSSVALKENLANKSTSTDLGGANSSDTKYPSQKAVKTYVDAQVNAGGVADGGITTAKLADAAVTNAKVATGIDKAKVGLGNVDNTADSAKPISALTQAALDSKASTFENVFTGRQMINGTSNGYVLGLNTAENGYWLFDEEGTLLFPNNTRIEAGTSTETILSAPINGNFSINTIGENGINNWKFKANGNIQLPYNSFLISDGEDLGMVAGENQSFFINTSYDDISRTWNFSPNGVLSFPDGTKLNIKYGGNENWFGLDLPNSKDFIISAYNDPYTPSNLWTFKSNGEMIFPDGSKFAQLEGDGTVGFGIKEETDFLVQTSSNSNWYEWEFNRDGSFAFPDNTKFTGNDEINNFNIKISEGKNLKIKTTNSIQNVEVDYQWTFYSDGRMEFPDGAIASGNISGTSNFGFDIEGGFSILTNNDNGLYNLWSFSDDGLLYFPDGTVTSGNISGTTNFGFDTRATNSGFSIITSGTSSGTSQYWEYSTDGSLTFPDGTISSGNISGTSNFGFDTRATNSGFSIITSGTSSGSSQNWSYSTDGSLTFPDGTITSGNISGTSNFGFDTRATNSGFSIITGTSTGTTKLWTFDNNGILNLPAGGGIQIDGISALSKRTEEFYIDITVGTNYFGLDINSQYDYKNSSNFNGSEVLLFPLNHTPLSVNQIFIYLDGRRIPKFASNNTPLYEISGSGVALYIDNFPNSNDFLSFDFDLNNILRITIDY